MRGNPVRPKSRVQNKGAYLRDRRKLGSALWAEYAGGRAVLTPQPNTQVVWLGTIVNGKNMRPYFVGALRQIKPKDLESALDSFPYYFERGVLYEGKFYRSFEEAALYNEYDFNADLVKDSVRRYPFEEEWDSLGFSGLDDEWVVYDLTKPKDVKTLIELGSEELYSLSFFVYVPSFSEEIEAAGRGYFEDRLDVRYTAAARDTGFRRIHSVNAIEESEQGTGLGLAVYTAGTMYAAYLDEVGHEDWPGEGAGISSGAGASESASLLWHKITQSGLADAFDANEEDFKEEELERGARNFVYLFERAVANGLVLDVNPKLVEQFASHVPDKLVLEILKNLDMREIDDPQAFDYFAGLMERFGATDEEVSLFMEEAAAHLEYPVAKAAFDAPRYFGKSLHYRLNPDFISEEKEEVAQVFFGHLFGTDEDFEA